nr:TPA_inf: conotoxin precursor M [Conus judaeus]
MLKVGVVFLVFLVLLSLADSWNGDNPGRQRGEKQHPQWNVFRSNLRKHSSNHQRRCANSTP